MTPPAGYTRLARGRCRATVRDDLVPALGPWLLRVPLAPPAGAVAIPGGRGAAFRLELAGGERAVVRFGRRGGAVARIVADRYVGVRPRPWRELDVALRARARGAPVAPVLAAGVQGFGVYRSVVVMAEVPDATTLLDAVGGAGTAAAREAIARRAAGAIARLHAAGVVHADLNLSNILVSRDQVAVVDLDRARLRRGPLGGRARARSLRRLGRSLARLDPMRRVIEEPVVRAFHDAYRTAAEGACGS